MQNKVRGNNGSHHKSTKKKESFNKHGDQLQTRINKAKETVFSFWTKKKRKNTTTTKRSTRKRRKTRRRGKTIIWHKGP